MELVREKEEGILFWSSIKSERRTIVLPGAQEDFDERGGLPNPFSRLIDKKNATYVIRRTHLSRVELANVSPNRNSIHPWTIFLPYPLEQDGVAFYVDPDGEVVRIFLLTLSNDYNYVHTLQLKSDQLSYQNTVPFKLGEVSSVVATGPDSLVVVGDNRLWQLDIGRRTSEQLLSQTPFFGRLLGKIPQGVFVQASYIQKHVAAVDKNGALILWSCASNRQVNKVELDSADVVIAPNRIGPPLLAVASSAFLQIYDVPDLRLLKRINLPNAPISVQWGSHTQVLLQVSDGGNLPRVMRIDVDEDSPQVMRPQYVATLAAQGYEELDVEVAQFNSLLANKYDYAKEEEIVVQWWVDRVCRRQRFPPAIIRQAVDNLENLVLPESFVKRLKLDSQTSSGTVRGFLIRKGAALETWDLGQNNPNMAQPSTPGVKTSVIHAVCSGAKELLAECFRLQSAIDVHQTWTFSEQWDTFVGITPSTFSMLRRITWWEQGITTLDVAKQTNVQAPLQDILEASDDPIWPIIVGSWFFTRSCIAPWLTVCYSLLEKSTVSLDALSSVSFDINHDIDEYVQQCFRRVSDSTLDILLARMFTDDDLGLRPTMNNLASLQDASHSSQLLTALESKVVFLLHVFALLQNYRVDHPRLLEEIYRRLPRMAVCSAGCALSYAGALPDMRLGDHLARQSTTYALLESIEFAQCLAQVEAWVLLDSWCEGRPGLRGYFQGIRWLNLKRISEAVEAFRSVSDDCFRELPGETPFAVDVPIEIQTKVTYLIHVSTLLESKLAYQDAFNFRKDAWIHWNAWASSENKEDESFQLLLWEKAFSLACNNQLWDEAVTAMFHLPSFNSRGWALRNLSTCLRIRGESNRILSWDFPEPLFQEYIADLQQQAYSFPPTLGSTSLHCYNVLYATFVAREEYGHAARVMYKMFLALQEYMLQNPIQHFSSKPTSRPVPGFDHTKILHATSLGAPDDFVRAEDPALLKVQRDALVLATQALELMSTPRFVLGHTEKKFSAETDVAVSKQDRLRNALHDAKIRANWVVVTPKTLKLCLLWTEARILILELLMPYGAQDARTPAEVVRLLCSWGFVNLGLGLAISLQEDIWSCVVWPFLQLCVTADNNPNSVTAIADAARGNLLSFIFTRHDGSEPLGLGTTFSDGDIATLMWRTLHEVAVRTNHEADVGRSLAAMPCA